MPSKPLAERIFVSASKGYRDLFGAENLPLDKRIFMESAIDRRRDPITERSLNADEQEQLRSLIASRYDRIKPKLKETMVDLRTNAAEALREASATRNPELRAFHLKRYKGISEMLNGIKSYFATGKLNPTVLEYGELYGVPSNIQREDYENPDEINADSGASLASPGRNTNIGQTLGRFNYSADNAGNLLVTDSYDFGAGAGGLFSTPGHRKAPIGFGDLVTPKKAAAKIGFRELPEGKGRPVKIKVNSMAPKKKEEANYFSRAAAYLGF